MNLPINSYPTDGATNENVLFSTLGSFWTRVFQDKASLRGLTLAQAEEVCQSYYDLLAAIDSYSASDVQVFKTVKWYPLLIKLSDINSNVLRFGEGVDFGATVSGESYKFGAAKPQEENVYVVPLPDKIQEISILANRVISPDAILVNNLDIQIKHGYIYFYGDPFKLKNASVSDLIGDDGTPVYFEDKLTGQPIPDKLLVLWAYHSKHNTNSLNLNIAYLFGVDIPITLQAKNILEAVVKIGGNPSVHRLKALCGAFIDVKPVLEDTEVIQHIFTTTTHHVVTTDQHVYRFDVYYTLKDNVKVGAVVNAGDILVDAVEYYDSVVYKNWWLSKMVPKIGENIKSPAYTLPSHMFAGNYKYGLTFSNDMELITRDSSGYIHFPVGGRIEDLLEFHEHINLPANKDLIIQAVGGLAIGSAKLINPLDFLFTTVFQTNTAMIKVNFKTMEQLSMFTEFFPVFKKYLPSHVYFLFFFDVNLGTETYVTTNIIDHEEVYGIMYPACKSTGEPFMEGARCNGTSSGANLYIQDRILVRTVPSGVSTRDYNFIDLTKDPRPDLQN